MTWGLLLSTLPIIILLALLFLHEKKAIQKDRRYYEENQKWLEPAARKANQLHEKRYGRPSTEIAKEFPTLSGGKLK